MGYRHSKTAILEAAVGLVVAHGLAALTYREVGTRLGVADRTVVYYFPTKEDLTAAVLRALADQLETRAADAIGDTPMGAAELLAKAWTATSSEEARALFRIYFEVVGRAAAGQQPFAALTAAMTERWIEWLGARLTCPVEDRRGVAAGVLAQLDGLMLLWHMAGRDVAEAAAGGLGVPGGGRRSDRNLRRAAGTSGPTART